MQVRPLKPQDAADFHALRLRGLAEEPTAFASSHEEEMDRSLASVALRLQSLPDRFVLGAWVDQRLVGVVGLGREEMNKLAHKAFVWGMYVAPEWRGQGLARRLIEALLARAREVPELRQVNLCVNAGNMAARQLYEALGFEAWGHEHGSMMVQGELQDEIHMALPLRPAPTRY